MPCFANVDYTKPISLSPDIIKSNFNKDINNITKKNQSLLKDMNNMSIVDKCLTKDYLKSYSENFGRKIRQNWHPPKNIVNNQMIFRFKIHKDGTVDDIRMLSSSRYPNPAFYYAAISAINKSSPFEPLPPEVKEEYINVQFIFKYDKNHRY